MNFSQQFLSSRMIDSRVRGHRRILKTIDIHMKNLREFETQMQTVVHREHTEEHDVKHRKAQFVRGQGWGNPSESVWWDGERFTLRADV